MEAVQMPVVEQFVPYNYFEDNYADAGGVW